MSRSPPGHVRDAVHWFARKAPPLPALNGVVQADVVVVGAGMMGLMCARTLAAHGLDVCTVEADTCGGAASGRSSGFITPDSELEFQDLVRRFGPPHARKLWEFALGGVELIRSAITADEIDCDFSAQDAFFVASSAGAAKTIAQEHRARDAAGFASTLYTTETWPRVLGGADYFGGLRFKGTFGMDAYRCCAGLRDRLLERGVRIYEQSPVVRISRDGVQTRAGEVRAAHVMVCTDRLLPRLGLAKTEIYHAQTFLAISEPLADATATRLFPDEPLMVWDTELVYHYFRLTREQRLLVGGGTLLSTYARRERHRPEQVARRLTQYLRTHFPEVDVRFAAAWPGLIGISKDFAPVIGRDPRRPNVHFAGGAAGLPWAAALGRALAERVATKHGSSEIESLLAVERGFPIGGTAQRLMGRQAAFALSHGWMKFKSG